jgi:hypothetical protein
MLNLKYMILIIMIPIYAAVFESLKSSYIGDSLGEVGIAFY